MLAALLLAALLLAALAATMAGAGGSECPPFKFDLKGTDCDMRACMAMGVALAGACPVMVVTRRSLCEVPAVAVASCTSPSPREGAFA